MRVEVQDGGRDCRENKDKGDRCDKQERRCDEERERQQEMDDANDDVRDLVENCSYTFRNLLSS